MDKKVVDLSAARKSYRYTTINEYGEINLSPEPAEIIDYHKNKVLSWIKIPVILMIVIGLIAYAFFHQ